MRIAILEHDPAGKSATGVRGRAIKAFLDCQGHDVQFICPAPDSLSRYHRRRYSLWSRVRRRLTGQATLPHLWDFLADQLEPPIRRGRFDAVIARGQDLGYVFARDL